MRPMIAVAVAVAVLCSVPGAAQSSGQQPPPPQQQQQQEKPKPEEKTAPAIAGKWTMTTVTQNGPLVSTMDLKVDGKKLTGTISSQMGEAAIAGEYADGKLAFSITMQTNNGAIDVAFKGALKDNGTLAGTLDTGSGTVLEWTAERAKDE